MSSGRAIGLVRVKKFKSRRQSLAQPAMGFDFAKQSGRLDLNQRPHGPEPCALAKLSYAPWFLYRRRVNRFVNGSAWLPRVPSLNCAPALEKRASLRIQAAAVPTTWEYKEAQDHVNKLFPPTYLLGDGHATGNGGF